MKKIYQPPTINMVELIKDVITYSVPNDDAIITEKDNWFGAFDGNTFIGN